MRTAAAGVEVDRRIALDPGVLPQELGRLHRVAVALCGSHHDAEDLVQETFACVLARPRTVSGSDHRHYLLAALRNTFLTQRRAERRRPRTPADPEWLESLEGRRPAGPDGALDRIAMLDAVLALPAGLRRALLAVDLVGLSYEETARALDVPVGTVMSRLHRARNRLARALEVEGTRPAVMRAME